MEDIFLVADFNGVAGIVAALVADHPVNVGGQNVNYFTFALIAPLGADQYSFGHVNAFSISNYRVIGRSASFRLFSDNHLKKPAFHKGLMKEGN